VWYFTAGNLTLLAIYATATQATQAIQTTFTDKFNIFFLFIKVSLNLRSLLNGYYGVLYSVQQGCNINFTDLIEKVVCFFLKSLRTLMPALRCNITRKKFVHSKIKYAYTNFKPTMKSNILYFSRQKQELE
jgi:hypothetical protein